jgi:hypothetical protein
VSREAIRLKVLQKWVDEEGVWTQVEGSKEELLCFMLFTKYYSGNETKE